MGYNDVAKRLPGMTVESRRAHYYPCLHCQRLMSDKGKVDDDLSKESKEDIEDDLAHDIGEDIDDELKREFERDIENAFIHNSEDGIEDSPIQ
jgi:hypothetical protein